MLSLLLKRSSSESFNSVIYNAYNKNLSTGRKKLEMKLDESGRSFSQLVKVHVELSVHCHWLWLFFWPPIQAHLHLPPFSLSVSAISCSHFEWIEARWPPLLLQKISASFHVLSSLISLKSVNACNLSEGLIWTSNSMTRLPFPTFFWTSLGTFKVAL